MLQSISCPIAINSANITIDNENKILNATIRDDFGTVFKTNVPVKLQEGFTLSQALSNVASRKAGWKIVRNETWSIVLVGKVWGLLGGNKGETILNLISAIGNMSTVEDMANRISEGNYNIDFESEKFNKFKELIDILVSIGDPSEVYQSLVSSKLEDHAKRKLSDLAAQHTMYRGRLGSYYEVRGIEQEISHLNSQCSGKEHTIRQKRQQVSQLETEIEQLDTQLTHAEQKRNTMISLHTQLESAIMDTLHKIGLIDNKINDDSSYKDQLTALINQHQAKLHQFAGMRSNFTGDDLKEIDALANTLRVQLIKFQQNLGEQNRALTQLKTRRQELKNELDETRNNQRRLLDEIDQTKKLAADLHAKKRDKEGSLIHMRQQVDTDIMRLQREIDSLNGRTTQLRNNIRTKGW